MSDLAFTDTHVHFYDLRDPALHYSWLVPDPEPAAGAAEEDDETGNRDALKAVRYWADDFIAESRLAGTTKAVHVQAAIGIEDPVEETRFVQGFADRLGFPLTIVAFADLTAGDAERVIERHLEYPGVCGIRDLRYDDYLTDPRWERGYALLEQHGLVCCDDPLVPVMSDAVALVKRYPGITYCIDHAGFPRRRDADYFEAWKRGMRSLAALDHTVVKISGLGMCDHRWTVDSIRPWVLECIDAWGVERSFFGTNWPVDRLFSSYTDVVQAYRRIIADFSRDEQKALFSGNADRIFRLNPAA